MAIIGIDLGTTNSLGCIYKNGTPRLIPNKYGEFLTPSAVSVLEDGSVIVGKKAKERSITHPETTAMSFKKDMGSDKKYTLGKHTFTPEELSSFVIQSILEDAKDFCEEPITEAVISVPAYFHDKQRAATKRAGALAGIYVERIVNEPSAAALAVYGNDTHEKDFLIFDFGGGTLDVSLVTCISNIVEIKAVAGNNHLGGDDFDELIANEVLKEHNINKEDISSIEYATLVKKARDCKEQLSEDEDAKIQIVINNQEYESTYTTKRLIKESAELLNKVKTVIGNALRDGHKKANQVSDIIMVGGSSKMPLMQSYLHHLFHKSATISSSCDEMIAIGLGVFCGIKEKNQNLKDYVLTDVCPFSLGTQTNNPHGHSFMSILIPRNSILPTSKVNIFTTSHDFQEAVKFGIYQGEQMYAKDNLLLDTLTVQVTPKPKGQELVEVRFSYDINGLLIVNVNVPSTQKNYTKMISEILNPEEIKARKKELEKLMVNPFDLPENQELLETLEQLFVQSNAANKQVITLLVDLFSNALASKSPSRIQSVKEKINKVIEDFSAWDPMDIDTNDDVWDDPWDESDEEEDEFSEVDFGSLS